MRCRVGKGLKHMQDRRPSSLLTATCAVQGLYYVATGVWPLLHLRSFEAITGKKADVWLVKTVGALIGVLGIQLLVAATRRRSSPEIVVAAVGSAAALAIVDVVYVGRRRIRPVYLLDSVAELVLILGWIIATRSASGVANKQD
jgi:hypothetical protein